MGLEGFRAGPEGKRIFKSEVSEHVVGLRKRGLSVVSVNTYLRSVNAFLAWAQAEGHDLGLAKIPKLKESRKVCKSSVTLKSRG